MQEEERAIREYFDAKEDWAIQAKENAEIAGKMTLASLAEYLGKYHSLDLSPEELLETILSNQAIEGMRAYRRDVVEYLQKDRELLRQKKAYEVLTDPLAIFG